MTKVRNQRDNMLKVLSNHMIKATGRDTEVRSCPRETGHGGDVCVGSAERCPHGPKWAGLLLHHRQKDSGLPPGPSRVGKELFIPAKVLGSSSCVRWLGVGQIFRKLPYFLLLGKAREVPMFSLRSSPPSTNQQKGKQP